MSKKIKLGDYNRLRIVKKVDFGLYLDGGDEGEILLPSRYVPEDAGIGDELDVFIYLDQEERLIATTETPLAKVGDFAYLEVKWVNEYGAFLGWGLMKDIFCPFREQKKRMVLTSCISTSTRRAIASLPLPRLSVISTKTILTTSMAMRWISSSGRRPISASRLSSTTSIRVCSIRTRFSSTSTPVTR